MSDKHNETLHEAVLHAPLAALRAELSQLEPPAVLQAHLLSAFARRHPPRRWYQRLSLTQWGLAGGIGSLSTVVLVFMLSLRAPLTVGPLPIDDGGNMFIALESAERIEQEPDPQVVQAVLPRSELAGLGVPVTPENAGESVRAELIVSADGRPLALRFSDQ
jgi:hypothetical protein